MERRTKQNVFQKENVWIRVVRAHARVCVCACACCDSASHTSQARLEDGHGLDVSDSDGS